MNRKAVWTEVDMHALRLMAVLVELIAQHDHRDRKRADDEIKNVGASQGRLSLAGIKKIRKPAKRSNGADSSLSKPGNCAKA